MAHFSRWRTTIAWTQVIAVPVVLGIVLHQAVRHDVIVTGAIDWTLLVAGVLSNQAALLVFASRMRRTLQIFDVTISWFQAIRIHLQSMFYYFVVPMTVGLEIARYLKIKAADPSSTTVGVGSALLLDRLFGALGALIVAVVFLPYADLTVLPAIEMGWTGFAAIAVVTAVAILFLVQTTLRRTLLEVIALLRKDWRGTISVALLSVATQLLSVVAIWLAARGLGIEMSFATAAFGASVATLFVVIPVSFAGAGPTEAAAVLIFILLGLSDIEALTVASLIYLTRLIAAAQGGIWQMGDSWREATGRTQEKQPAPRTESEELTQRTIEDFGEQWTQYQDNPGYYGSQELLTDIVEPLLPVASIVGARVAEIGSGSGRIVNMLLDAGAAHVVAVEPSDAMRVLRQNTASRAGQIDYVHGRGEALPPSADRDIVVSIGVLHHIPEPAPVVRAAVAALRPGGMLFVWLYAHEGNETYLRFAHPLRAVTPRLPHWALSSLCHVLNVALDIYIVLARFLPVPMRDYVRNVVSRLPRRVRYLTIYDQLNPAFAKYYTRAEAEALLADAGLSNIISHHRQGYSWSVLGTRPQS